MFNIRTVSANFPKLLLLASLCAFGCVGAHAASEAEITEAKNSFAMASKAAADAQAAKDIAQKTQDALAAQHASKPSTDTERKLKNAEYEVMMANSKLSSATKTVERAQKKLDESQSEEKNAQQQTVKADKVLSDQKALADKAKTQAANEETKKVAEAQARKDEEVKVNAAQKASEDAKLAAIKASEAARALKASEEAAKKRALAAQMGIDENCAAIPAAPSKPNTNLSVEDLQLQAYAQGELNQINRIVAKKAADDVPPISPFPSLQGTKLNPCDPDQKLALKFGYMGNGQYRLETPVLAGEQEFSVKGVGQPLNRTIPESDNGETYIFFLDGREGRAKLTCFKKSLLGQLQ